MCVGKDTSVLRPPGRVMGKLRLIYVLHRTFNVMKYDGSKCLCGSELRGVIG